MAADLGVPAEGPNAPPPQWLLEGKGEAEGKGKGMGVGEAKGDCIKGGGKSHDEAKGGDCNEGGKGNAVSGDDEQPVPGQMHPWAVAPCTRGRSVGLSAEEVETLRRERAAADYASLKWGDRGPPGPDRNGPLHWRGQQWRQGSDGGTPRYSNRGGRNREWYAQQHGKRGRDENDGGKGHKGGSSSSSSHMPW